MKLELRRITHNARLSQETPAYAADIWVDGVKRGNVMNEGHGGADRITPHSLEQEINAYAKTLPLTDCYGKMLPQTAESLFAGLLDRHLATKRLTRLMKTKKVIARDGKIYTAPMTYPGKPGDLILNALPMEDALTKFLASE